MSTDQSSTTTSPTDPYAGWRVRPTFKIALAIYLGYLAIFFATWIVNDVDYPHIGDTVRSTRIHYAAPPCSAASWS